MSHADPDDALAFAERLLALLDEGTFTATYKFAVLIALMDLCFERTGEHGEPPSMVTTTQLAEKVVALYYPHTRPYDREADADEALRQNTGPKRARVLADIERFRAKVGDASATLHRARLAAPDAYRALVAEVEWTLVLMPLPKLQRFGREEQRFVYEIGWSDDITKGAWRKPGFDNAVRFVGRAAEHLVRLSPLLRPLIQQKWAEKVGKLNRLEVARLEGFLFGTGRTDLSPVREGLRDIQRGACFYCDGAVRDAGQIDHFLPWARQPDDGLDNLVLAHAGCNQEKRDFLAAARHLERWRSRSEEEASALARLAEEERWPREPERILGSVRAVYLRLPDGVALWLGRGAFEQADGRAIRAALVA